MHVLPVSYFLTGVQLREKLSFMKRQTHNDMQLRRCHIRKSSVEVEKTGNISNVCMGSYWEKHSIMDPVSAAKLPNPVVTNRLLLPYVHWSAWVWLIISLFYASMEL